MWKLDPFHVIAGLFLLVLCPAILLFGWVIDSKEIMIQALTLVLAVGTAYMGRQWERHRNGHGKEEKR